MKLLVLGATGGIGLEIVRQAVARHHSVTAFVRSPDRLAAFQGCIAFEQGTSLSTTELELLCAGAPDTALRHFGTNLLSKVEEARITNESTIIGFFLFVSHTMTSKHYMTGITNRNQTVIF
jgi:putative NADH-flavin reductase